MKKNIYLILVFLFIILSLNVYSENINVNFQNAQDLINETYDNFNENTDYGNLNADFNFDENFDNDLILNIDLINYEYPNGSTRSLDNGNIEIIPNQYINYEDFSQSATGSGSKSGGIIFNFNDTLQLYNNSVSNVTLFVNNWRYSSSIILMLFNDNSLEYTTSLFNSGSDFQNAYFDFPITENNTKFNKMYIGFVGDGDVFNFQNMTIYNTDLIGNNQLPNVNISYDENLCLNETIGSLTVPLNYNISDPENDTVHYAYKEYSSYSDNTTVIFYDRICDYFFGLIPLCTNNRDYSFLSDVYYPDENTCLISQDSYNESKFNLYFDNEIYGLRLNNCSGSDKSFYYNLNLPTKNINYVTELRNIDNNDILNISLLSEDLIEIARINLNTSEDRLYINYYNGSDLINIGNITSQEDTLLEFYDVDVTQDNFIFRVWESGLSLPYLSGSYNNYTIPILNDEYVKYVKHNINSNTDLLIMGLQFRGVLSNLDFTNEQITNFTINELGSYYYTIYTSDNINQPNKFNTHEINFNVVSCDVFIETDEFMKDIRPNTRFEFLNNLLYAIRQPYLIFVQLNILDQVLFAFKVGIIFIFYKWYKKLSLEYQGKEHKDIFRTIFINLFIVVTVLYVMFLIEKIWFISFSVFGLLYLSNEILHITGSADTDNGERNITYTLAMYSVLSYIWFSLFSTFFGVNMGIPDITTSISFSNPFVFITSAGNYLLGLLFFTIPNIPVFINLIVVLIRLLGIISLVIYVYEKINPIS